MKITRILTVAAAVVAAVMLASCGQKKFHVNGAITDAQDSVLYLEHMSLEGPVAVDSVRLGADGAFAFTCNALDTITPDIYRLRIAGQIINLCIDSTETVTVRAAYPSMSVRYDVRGSYENEKIRDLAYMQNTLQNQINVLVQSPELGVDAVAQTVQALLTQYKKRVVDGFIYREPMRGYSYFALFQTYRVGNRESLIFDPRVSADDIKVYGAVATSWDTYYPGSERGQNLHNIAIENMKNQRIVKAEREASQIDASKVEVTNVIDIALLDNKGVTRRLTDLKGKVVLLDLHVFASDESPKRIMWLRDIYNKYHARGLEIYQVSYDDNEHFWKTQVAALPWVSVFRNSVGNGGGADTYLNGASRQLPAMFLLDRESNVVKGPSQIQDLDAEISRLL